MRPELEGGGSLIQQHPESIGCPATRCLCSPKQRGFKRSINHVVHGIGATQRIGLNIQGQRIFGLQARRGGVEDELDVGVGQTCAHIDRRKPVGDLGGQFGRLRFGAVLQPQGLHPFIGQPQGRRPTGTARTQQQDAGPAGFHEQVFAEGANDGIGVGVVSAKPYWTCEGPQKSHGSPNAFRVLRLENHGVHCAPRLGRDIQIIHHAQGQALVRHREVHAAEAHHPCSFEGDSQLLGRHFTGHVPPIQTQRRQRGIVHGRRSGMPDRRTPHRGQARGGRDRLGHRLGHREIENAAKHRRRPSLFEDCWGTSLGPDCCTDPVRSRPSVPSAVLVANRLVATARPVEIAGP